MTGVAMLKVALRWHPVLDPLIRVSQTLTNSLTAPCQRLLSARSPIESPVSFQGEAD